MADVGDTEAKDVASGGQAGSFEEPRSVDQVRPRGAGWRQLRIPIVVPCFLQNTWVDAPVIDVNDETREIRIQWPPLTDSSTELGAHHEVLDASHYRPVPGLF